MRITNFYPRPPRGGRQTASPSARMTLREISIHALREEGDTKTVSRNVTALRFLSTPSARRATFLTACPRSNVLFLSTPSARRATFAVSSASPLSIISIHALREEGDRSFPGTQKAATDFYPRPPRGGRRAYATQNANQTNISIHALREEGDGYVCADRVFLPKDFYPRPPRGGRPFPAGQDSRWPFYFYPRPPRGGRRVIVGYYAFR